MKNKRDMELFIFGIILWLISFGIIIFPVFGLMEDFDIFLYLPTAFIGGWLIAKSKPKKNLIVYVK